MIDKNEMAYGLFNKTTTTSPHNAVKAKNIKTFNHIVILQPNMIINIYY